MLKRNIILSILFLIISITFLTYSSPPEIELSENTNNGGDLSSLKSISSISNNILEESFIVVNLWASWCIPCIEEVEELKKISNDNNYYVIGLLVDDSTENGKEFIDDYSIKYENILNEDDVEYILTNFSWKGIPTSLILNLEYEIIHTFSGPVTYKMISEVSK